MGMAIRDHQQSAWLDGINVDPKIGWPGFRVGSALLKCQAGRVGYVQMHVSDLAHQAELDRHNTETTLEELERAGWIEQLFGRSAAAPIYKLTMKP